MISFLLSNLALLVIVQTACCLHNRFTSGPAIDGRSVFTALALLAFLLDATLTFLVFADARSRYGQFGSSDAFFGRACAYGLAIIAAFAWRSVARRLRREQVSTDKPVVIHTSPHSESQLPM